jgi:hypothetical protein
VAESLGRWYELVGIVLVVLLPKSDGGRIPICLFPTIIRIWMRLRLGIARAWMSANDRSYLYAGHANGADVAAWKQSLLAEAAAGIRLLIKAFDSVPFDWLVKQADKYKYNLWLLRLSLAAYLLGRVLDIDGCCSGVIWVTRGIAAGSVLTTIELRVLLIEFADAAVAASIYCRITLYVDDATIETICTAKRICKDHTRVTNVFTDALRGIRMLFSDTKNVVCASKDGIKRIQAKLRGINVKVAKRVVFFWFGRRGWHQEERHPDEQTAWGLQGSHSQVQCYEEVRTDRLLRTGGNAALTFGQKALGVSNSMLFAQRRSADAMTCDKACGADLDLSLAVTDGESMGAADPAFDAHVGVIHMWSLAVWEAWAPRKLLDTLVKGTIMRLNEARNVWAVVRGPAEAFVATVQRLGWTVGSATLLTDDKGRTIDLGKGSPAYVKGLVVYAVQRWRWSRIEKKLHWLATGHRGVGAWWLPISRALRQTNSDGCGAAHKGAFKSAVMGRQWTQQRLHAAHLADDSLCRLCIELPGGQQVGTLLHRTCCPALVDFNRQFMPECVREVLTASAGEPGQLTRGCLIRGLFPYPAPAPRPMAMFDTFHWHTEPRGVSARARVCSDGSLLHGQWGRDYAALGWAFVAFDQSGEILAAAYGVHTFWVDTIQGAELWAVHMVIASMSLPEVLFTDCKTVQEGVRNTAQWAGSSKRRYAMIWTVLHAGLDE